MARDPDRAFFGHPIGLSTLFFTEMWERFSYYGMRPLLALFMTYAVKDGGLGMTDSTAGVIVGLFLSGVYLLSLPGGWIADRFLGQRKSVIWGGIGISIGNALLAIPSETMFFPGLIMIAIGTGFLKPNISTMVGQLYSQEDPRRDAGFTIYYIGINIGALLAPFATGFLAQSDTFKSFLAGNGINPAHSWRFAFGASAIVMALGVVQYIVTYKRLGDAGLHPTIPDDPKVAKQDVTRLYIIGAAIAALAAVFVALNLAGVAISPDLVGNLFGIGLVIGSVYLFYALLKGARDKQERNQIVAMIPLFLGGMAFFAAFEQASSTLSLYTDRFVKREFGPLTILPVYWQSANSVFVIAIAPIAAMLWLNLARKKKEPASTAKFAIGMVFTALSFAVLIPSVNAVVEMTPYLFYGNVVGQPEEIMAAVSSERISAMYLIVYYLMATFAELCISPVGLSSMSRLAPTRMAGMVMGTWFLATANGNYLAGRAAGVTASSGYGFLFWLLVFSALVVSAILFIINPRIKRMMGSDPAAAPVEKSEKAEPDPLPQAKVVDKD